ncbi:cytochrome P450 [Candidatus Poriferisocius sp.]|uniref:cytochrome P450 n=1 Tax=Candidatus Poriferisocius sp. TaxID=3101276 RepID=UPI003B02B847
MYDLTACDTSFADRDQQLAELREHNPVAWDDENGWWLITRHADITSVSRDTETFSSKHGVTYFSPTQLSMITMDPPDHTRLRRLVSKQFTPRMVKLWRGLAARKANQGIDRLLAAGGGDFVEEVAVPTTLAVIMHMLGIGEERRADIRNWSDDMMAAGGRSHIPGVTEKGIAAGKAWTSHLAGHIEDKLANPTDDLLSLVAADSEDPLTGEDLRQFALLLIVAGNETTRHSSSFGVELFAQYPDQAAAIRANADLMPTAIPEVLRWTSIIRAMSRTATKTVELGGVTIKEGQLLNLIYPSANRDEAVFEDPFTFDIRRDPNPHLAFGIGTHYCLGANLAQLQLNVILGAWLQRVPAYQVVGVEHFHTGMVTGLKHLMIEVG